MHLYFAPKNHLQKLLTSCYDIERTDNPRSVHTIPSPPPKYFTFIISIFVPRPYKALLSHINKFCNFVFRFLSCKEHCLLSVNAKLSGLLHLRQSQHKSGKFPVNSAINIFFSLPLNFSTSQTKKSSSSWLTDSAPSWAGGNHVSFPGNYMKSL